LETLGAPDPLRSAPPVANEFSQPRSLAPVLAQGQADPLPSPAQEPVIGASDGTLAAADSTPGAPGFQGSNATSPLALHRSLVRDRLAAEHLVPGSARGVADRDIRLRLERDAVLFLTQD
jgi:hypothetical protein